MSAFSPIDQVNQFHSDGYLVVEDVFEESLIDDLYTKGMQNFNELISYQESNALPMGIGVKHCYKEIVQRHLNRYEMPYKMDNDETFGVVLRNKLLMSIIKGILGDDCVVINKSLVVSQPGAQDQAWHSDGPHLSADENLPCHCLNVFVPLVAVDIHNGPTQMRPGSVPMTKDLKKSFLRAFMNKSLRSPHAPDLSKGSILMFDYRILHRGLANKSTETRPVLVYTFAKPYYVDNMNFPRNSIFAPIDNDDNKEDKTMEEKELELLKEGQESKNDSSETLIYRVTGPQSIDRLEPLIQGLFPQSASLSATKDVTAQRPCQFVWETACEISWRNVHANAIVLNKLHNITILEDKANLAFLQLKMNCPTLDSYIANNVQEVQQWATYHWQSAIESISTEADGDWWVVKASAGNGGKDVWVMNKSNMNSIIAELPVSEKSTFVIQKYVTQPLLYLSEKKFHFRCYSLLQADMSGWMYDMCYILSAGFAYNSVSDMDDRKLITNLSVNKHIQGHPGQVPCNVMEAYPAIYSKICTMWSEVCQACTPFMSIQTSPHHFEFFGIDIIADVHGNAWLLEVNRLPGLESSTTNKTAEDEMYDTMMRTLLKIVMQPLLQPDMQSSVEEGIVKEEQVDMWRRVHAGSVVQYDRNIAMSVKADAPTWKNMFSWKAFTRKKDNRQKLVVSQLLAKESEEKEDKKKVEDTKESRNLLGDYYPFACGLEECFEDGILQCSRCKQRHYCCVEHQKKDWKEHKKKCIPVDKQGAMKLQSSHATSTSTSTNDGVNSSTKKAATSTEARVSRCMFCGEMITLYKEEDAVEHMRSCPALQEQLNKPEEQFTVPKVLRDKGVKIDDVKNAPSI